MQCASHALTGTIGPAVTSGLRALVLCLLLASPALADSRVVIDDRRGVIVMGAGVCISHVAIAPGNPTVRVTKTPEISQPNALAEGDTVVVRRTQVEAEEGGGQPGILEEGISLWDLVAGLDALGVGLCDLIGILQAIEVAGASRHADIVVLG